MSIIISICSVLVILTVILAGPFIFQYLTTGSIGNKPKTIDEIADEHADAMANAQKALDDSRVLITRLQNSIKQSEADTAILNARVKKAVSAGSDDEARGLIARLQQEEQKLQDKKTDLDKAKKNHALYEQIVDQQRHAILEAKKSAEDAKTRLELANTAGALQKSVENLQGVSSVMVSVARNAESKIQAANMGNEDNEFLQAANQGEVEKRLAEFKKEKS
jgi:hypothetical protein